jgi:YesN/AraC family two-component response regulator
VGKLDISVLFVEDEELLRAIYERILEKYVERLYVAQNGKEGLEVYEKVKPDLIITDIQMPVMDGLEMIDVIRKEDQRVRIVILSAYGEAEYFMDAIKIGVNSFLIKPVETKKLISLVEELGKGIVLQKELMAQELKRKEAEENLRMLNEELEKIIEERTKDLQHEIKEKILAEDELKQLNLTLEKRVKES